MAQTFDVCIRGAGVVGRALALLLARERLRVALVQPPSAGASAPDVRAYTLDAASRALLESVRGWPEAGDATAVLRMQVYADRDGAVDFDSVRQGGGALAWVVDVPALQERLAEAVRFQPLVEVLTQPVATSLTVVCEGRASRARAEFGAEFDVTPYAQSAIATRLDCERPHGQTARQWFLADGGILAFIPLGGAQGRCVAVVWSVPEDQAAQWLHADDESFTAHLRQASRGALGALRMSAPRALWPLQQARARRWCGRVPGQAGQCWALAGDAAHNVHPLAGQGLNLGLADAQALARALHERQPWRALSDPRALRRYERERKAALLPAALVMDGLQQLFTRRESALAALRNWGMKGFERSGPLKNWVMRQAMRGAQYRTN